VVLSVAGGAPQAGIDVGLEPYIESVFENDLVELDATATLAAAEANEHALITAETRRLHIAAHWADLHPGDAIANGRIRGAEHAVRLGGDGTPDVAEFAPAELGCVLRLSDGAAGKLIADALDLRHRLKLTWAAALSRQVPAYQARYLASATRHLSVEQAGCVDACMAPSLGAVSFGRLQTLVDAAIIEADPAGAEQRAAAAAKERFVQLGRSSEHGLKMIIARAAAGDAIWFKATIDRIADILARQGDPDPVEVRRSKAVGILAQPAHALQLLHRHQHDPWDGPTEPADHNQEPGPDQEPDRESDPDQASAENDIDADHGEAHQSLHITQPPVDPDKAQPRAIVYVHLSAEALTAGTGIARVEGVGPIVLSRLQMLLGGHCQINLKPVIDLPAGHIPIDCYEIPASLREQILLRYPADVFPYANMISRSVDIDHTIAYLTPDKGGPPGQTRIGNLGPHIRYHHRIKTHGGWQVCQPERGTWLWRSPHQRIYLVNPSGTHPLGNTEFAETIWRAASDPAAAFSAPS
jgi:hypothetical protein